jgi:hypothetical protein
MPGKARKTPEEAGVDRPANHGFDLRGLRVAHR